MEDSDAETLLKEKFGKDGVQVYRLCNNKRSVMDVYLSSNVGPDTFVGIIDFLVKEKMILPDGPFSTEELRKEMRWINVSKGNKGSKPVSKNEQTKDTPENATDDSFPPLLDLYDKKIAAFLSERKYDEAIRYYSNALKLAKNKHTRAARYNDRGSIYYKKKQFGDAIHDFDSALKLNRDYSDAFHNRGLAYASMEEYEKAIVDFTRYIHAHPNNLWGYYLRALSYEFGAGQGRLGYKISYLGDAIRDYQKALELKPDFTGALTRLKGCEEKKGMGVENVLIHGERKELVNPTALVAFSSTNLSNIAGMKKLKEVIAAQILYPLQHKERAEGYGKTFGGGIILYGPPGCGKSYLVEAIAGEAGVRLIRANIADILNMYVGNSEKNLALIFEEARKNQPCILFFDEIEALGGRREGMREHWERTLVNQFLLEMDKMEKNNELVLIIGATNAPWEVDHALRRSGRFGHILFADPPDIMARIELFRMYTKTIRMLGTLDNDELARLTDGFSCANIKSLCEKARDIAWKEAVEKNTDRKIEMHDFREVIAHEQSDVKEWFGIAEQHAANPLFRETYRQLAEYMKTTGERKEKEKMFG